MSSRLAPLRGAPRTDVSASVVVLLVSLPLCVGVAVASGVPAELGLITGIVAGLVTGMLPGSRLQVSGPTPGLTVLVFAAVKEYGLPTLGVIVLATGLLQITLGALSLGRVFRAISLAVVHGMLAGIGLVIVAGQLFTLADHKAPGSGMANITALPVLTAEVATSGPALTAVAVGGGTIVVMMLWKTLPGTARLLPGPLVAVVAATASTTFLDLPLKRVQVSGLLTAIQLPDIQELKSLANFGVLSTVIAFTFIASAESLISAAAVDRLHDGPKTDYDKELMAQGAGNTLCGWLGALPMAAVIIRSSANIQAGARTKLSRVLHSVWLLLFAALLPSALGMIPVAALAGILIHAGIKLLPVKELRPLWREHRGEAIVLLVTAGAILITNMFQGVLIGLLLAVVKTAWESSRVHIDVNKNGSGQLRVHFHGSATFLRLPQILDTLEALPADRSVELDLTGLRHLDHACMNAIQNWAEQHNAHALHFQRAPAPV
ncbi:SulP family inorganic anion transporter [Streptomyces sp. NBC_00687]|uniref:SulP family inorganic anion transporter n=1 Tax=Streptomyces sp. NBC_00687 TaxID=2975807 RepID=UPI00224E5F76|nr:SulP family inorganic anion transporter [Streptomyces sp. NBC_00687]MCX4920012.1 SulP family inorganic anion transporter [Streptomyces sp. NBC_00687]